jgi:TonB family protein
MLYAVLLSGCATTGSLGIESQSSSHARVTLVPAASDNTTHVVPQAIEPQLPSADRMSRVIDTWLGDEASVDVRFCVSPSGKVASASLRRGSTLPAFDEAVMKDIVDWEFAAQPGPDSLQTCQLATIVYRPHR